MAGSGTWDAPDSASDAFYAQGLTRYVSGICGMLCSALTRSTSTEATLLLVRPVLSTLLGAPEAVTEPPTGADPQLQEDLDALARLCARAREAAGGAGPPAPDLRAALLADAADLAAVVDAIVGTVAAEGRPGLDDPASRDALWPFLTALADAAPARLLRVLSGHLSGAGCGDAGGPGGARVELLSAVPAWQALDALFLSGGGPASASPGALRRAVEGCAGDASRVEGLAGSLALAVEAPGAGRAGAVLAAVCREEAGAAESPVLARLVARAVARGAAGAVAGELARWALGEGEAPPGARRAWASALGWCDGARGCAALLQALLAELGRGVAAAAAPGAAEAAEVPARARDAAAGLLRGPVEGASAVVALALHRVVTRGPLPLGGLAALRAALGDVAAGSPAGREGVAALAAHAAQVWGDARTAAGAPPPAGAYATEALCCLLACLGPGGAERAPGVVGGTLEGVSERLGSPVEVVRRQGMRVGNCLARLTPAGDAGGAGAAAPLFDDPGCEAFAAVERWPGMAPRRGREAPAGRGRGGPGPGAGAGAGPARAAAGAGGGGAGPGGKWTVEMAEAAADSDDDDGSDAGSAASEDSLEAYDLGEEPDERDEQGRGPPESLAGLLRALRRGGDDPVTAVLALRAAEGLIRCAPEELGVMAADLAHSLLHARVPAWADGSHNRPAGAPAPADPAGEGPTGQEQRAGALVALVAAEPRRAGSMVLRCAFGDDVDVTQRHLALDCVVAAAAELAAPPAGLAGPGARRGPGPGEGEGGAELAAPPPGTHVRREGKLGRTRITHQRALARREEERRNPPRQWRNRAAGVAREWADLILRGMGKRAVYLDVAGRDYPVLGRCLVALGSIAEAAAPHPEALPVATALLGALRAPGVADHPQPYVRRLALLSALQAMGAVGPAAAAGALAGAAPDALGSGLAWVREWAERAAAGDPDPQCASVARACVHRHAELAAGALRVLEAVEGSGQAVDRGTLRGLGEDPLQKTLRGLSLGLGPRVPGG